MIFSLITARSGAPLLSSGFGDLGVDGRRGRSAIGYGVARA
jgi:hypothetical protein